MPAHDSTDNLGSTPGRRQVSAAAAVLVAVQVAVPAAVQAGRLFLGWDTVRYGWLMFSFG